MIDVWQLSRRYRKLVAPFTLILLITCGHRMQAAGDRDRQEGLPQGLKTGTRKLQSTGLVEYDCEISLVARDYFSQAPQHDYACSNIQNGELFQVLPPSNSNIHPTTGDRITVRGMGVQGLGATDNTVVVDSWYNYRPAKRRHLQSAVVGMRSATMLFLRFTSSTSSTGFLGISTDSPDKRKTIAKTARDTLFGGSAVNPSHADAWNQCSYGKLNLKVDSDGLNTSGIVGQYGFDFPDDKADVYYADVPSICSQSSDPKCTNDYNIATSCGSNEYYGVVFYALSQLEATIPGFSRNTYQHKVVVLDLSNTACSFVGLGNVGCGATYCFSWIPTGFSQHIQVYTHEMGHNLGLAHAGVATASNSLDRQYGDNSDAMGYCCTTRCYNGPHAYELGWIQATELSALTITNSTDYILNSMSNNPINSLISITEDWTGGDGNTYWVQLKTAASYDQYLPTSLNVLNNIQIKQWNKAPYALTLDQGVKLGAGGSWVDPSGMVIVTVNSINLSGTNGSATVNIRWAKGTGTLVTPPTLAPTVTPTALPTTTPTQAPSPNPTPGSSWQTTLSPTKAPSPNPTPGPSWQTTLSPTKAPTLGPISLPTTPPTALPTIAPLSLSTFSPSLSVATASAAVSCRIPCRNALGIRGILVYRLYLGGRLCRTVCITGNNQDGNSTRMCGKCPARTISIP